MCVCVFASAIDMKTISFSFSLSLCWIGDGTISSCVGPGGELPVARQGDESSEKDRPLDRSNTHTVL